jgi:hypothetical protein
MLASRYYHALHITQLLVMHRLTGINVFAEYSERFQSYLDRPANRRRGPLRGKPSLNSATTDLRAHPLLYTLYHPGK